MEAFVEVPAEGVAATSALEAADAAEATTGTVDAGAEGMAVVAGGGGSWVIADVAGVGAGLR